MEEFVLRKLLDEDIPLFKKWLYLPHVATWYHDPQDWLYEVENRNVEYTWLHHFIAEVDGKPMGFCQYYAYCNNGETWHGNTEVQWYLQHRLYDRRCLILKQRVWKTGRFGVDFANPCS